MTTTNFGKIDEFHPECKHFSVYRERVELYFIANDIPEEKQVPVFLSVIGGKVYALLRDLLFR